MDINAERQHVLNRFPQKYRQHILDFSRNLSDLDVDVLIFTARKAACFFHCLEYLRLWEPGKRVVTTDRLVDHDTSWIKGKRVAIIDEVIVSGTSLYRLATALRKAGAAEIKIHALFINKEWFVPEFFKNNVLAPSYIALDGPDAQALGTTIVRAFYCIPRPYSIDYPMSGRNTLGRHQADSLAFLPGWQWTQIEEQWAFAGTTRDADRLDFFRFEPEQSSLEGLSLSVGIQLTSVSLVKVRTYGKWETADGKETYHFRVVPYVILGELSAAEIDSVFTQIAAACSSINQSSLVGSCVSDKARLRLIQYVFASRLGKAWAKSLQNFGINVSFVEDQREVSFIFPTSIHDAVAELCASTPLRVLLPTASLPTAADEQLDFTDPVNLRVSTFQYLHLSGKFLDLYLSQEIPARQRAQELGEAYFSDSTAQRVSDRLNRGLTVDELTDWVQTTGVSVSYKQLSMFLDIAVDSGIVVPITVERSHADGTRTVSRAYRYGEETYILQRDLGLFHSLLLNMADDVYKQVKGLRLSSALTKPHRLTKVLLEKVLVLFVRYAIAKGIFPRVYADSDDREPGAVLVGIGYDLFGARVAVGEHKPTNLPYANTFVRWLLNTGILHTDSDDGYEIDAAWVNPFSRPDKAQLAETIRFSAVLASAVGYLADRASGLNTPSKGVTQAIDRTFVTLTTCESEASTLMAIGAELRRFDKELENLGVVATATIDFRRLVQEKPFVKTVIAALNSGFLKMNAFIYGEAARNSEQVSQALAERDKVYGSLWDDIWEAAKRDQSPANREALYEHLVGAVEVLLKGLLLTHWVRSIALQDGGASLRSVATAAKSLHIKLSQLDKLADELSASRQIAHVRLEAAVSRARDYLDFVANPSRKDWPDTSRRLVNEFVQLRVLARDQFEWIDSVTGDDGRIARLEEYDSFVVMRMKIDEQEWNTHFSQRFFSITSAAVQRFRTTTIGPKAYIQESRLNEGGGNFLMRPVRFKNEEIFISFLSSGKRGVGFLGYVFGECVKLAAYRNISYSASIVLGLENSRKIHKDSKSGAIVVPTTSKALLQLGQQNKPEGRASFTTVIDCASKIDYLETLRKEMATNLRRGAQSLGSSELEVPSAGGSFRVEKFVFPIKEQPGHKIRRVAWVVIVEDEGSSLLHELEQLGIDVKSAQRADGKIIGEAYLPLAGGDVTLRIYISSAQGNTPIGNLLSNIASTEKDGLNFIVVSGICCSLGDSSTLTKVAIPTSVLDTQLGVETNDGQVARAAGPALATKPLQLVRWYFMLKGKRKLSSAGSSVDDIEVLDNTVMVSDNKLLRTDDPNEKHRSLALAYSSKAVAYDMETAGIVNWGHENPHFPAAVVIKGLSDFGLPNKKDDENRKLAAKNAMLISMDFIELSMSHEADVDSQ